MSRLILRKRTPGGSMPIPLLLTGHTAAELCSAITGLFAAPFAACVDVDDIIAPLDVLTAVFASFAKSSVFVVSGRALAQWLPTVALAFAAAPATPFYVTIAASACNDALVQAAAAWDDVAWRAITAVFVYDHKICGLLEAAIAQHTKASLNGIVCGSSLDTPLVPRGHREPVDWGAVRRADLIPTRIHAGGAERVVLRARGAGIDALIASVEANAALRGEPVLHDETSAGTLWVCDERLDESRTLEEYGIDDETLLVYEIWGY